MGEGLFSFGRRSSRSFVSSFFIPFPIICGHFDEEAFSSLFDFASFYFFIVFSCVESDEGNSIVGIIYVPECYFLSLLRFDLIFVIGSSPQLGTMN